MNTNQQYFPILGWMLGLIALAMVAISPVIVLGYNQVAFTIVPALQAVTAAVCGR